MGLRTNPDRILETIDRQRIREEEAQAGQDRQATGRELETEIPDVDATTPDVLFRGLSRRPVWAGAMFLGSCLVLAGTVLIPPELMIATLRERMLEQGQPFPPGLADRMAAIRIGGAVAAFVFWWVALAIFAGVVMVLFAVLMGHEGTYRQYLAVVAHQDLEKERNA